MPVKMFSARVTGASEEVLELLWRSHEAWNAAMRDHVKVIMAALRGEVGETPVERASWQAIAGFIKGTQIKPRVILEPCSKPDFRPNKRTGPLTPFLDEIAEEYAAAGGHPKQRPQEWMKILARRPEWCRACGEEWTPLPEEASQDGSGTKPERKTRKGAQRSLAPAKRRLTPAERLAKRLDKHSATFRELVELLDSGWRDLRVQLGTRSMFDREVLTPGWGTAARRCLYDATGARLRSYWKLLENWHREHRTWLDRKAEFEQENRDYLEGFKSAFDAFYREEGQSDGRRTRWVRYLEFLKAHPEFTAFRGLGDGQTVVLPSGPEYERALAEHQRRSRKIPTTGVELRFLLEANPGLEALHEVDQEYRDKYLRESRKRRNADGFTVPPSFTLPDPLRHPVWMEFQRGDKGYELLELCQSGRPGRLMLTLPGKKKVELQFQGGDRMAELQPLAQPVEFGRDRYEFTWTDRQKRSWLAQIQGIKLVFKRVRDLRERAVKPGAPLLFFSLDLRRQPEEPVPLDPEVTAAVDLGIHIPAAVTVRHRDGRMAVRLIRDKDLDAATATGDLRREKRRLSRRRRQSRRYGPPTKGNSRRFQQHINASGDDRVKKLAEKIVSYAVSRGAGTLIVEDLSGLTPRSAELRAINRSITGWLRARLLERLEQEAEEAGMKLDKVWPGQTSRVCHKCGSWGVRYDRKPDGPKFGPVGALFVCARDGCLKDFNADVNASFNLHAVRRKEFVRPAGVDDWKVLRARCEERLCPRSEALAKDDLIF